MSLISVEWDKLTYRQQRILHRMNETGEVIVHQIEVPGTCLIEAFWWGGSPEYMRSALFDRPHKQSVEALLRSGALERLPGSGHRRYGLSARGKLILRWRPAS